MDLLGIASRSGTRALTGAPVGYAATVGYAAPATSALRPPAGGARVADRADHLPAAGDLAKA
jgi:hypothetical protein